MRRVLVAVLTVVLLVGVAPAAVADVRPNAQCYTVGKVREVAEGTVECVLWSAGLARWRLIPSPSTRAGAVDMLNYWWSTFNADNQSHTCQRFGRYPRKFAWEVARAFPAWPTPVMVQAAGRVFTAKCS